MVKFIIFGSGYDYSKLQFNDVLEDKDVYYIDGFIDKVSLPVRVISRIKYSKYGLLLPIKKSWFNKYHYTEPSDQQFSYYFIFHEGVGRRYINDGSTFLNYLKEKYTDSKYILYLTNKYEPNRDANIKLRDWFDMIITFDPDDAVKYGFSFFPQFLSRCKIRNKYTARDSDVYFLGKVKNRLGDIIHMYEMLTASNLTCNFILVGVPKDKQIQRDGIIYCKGISYEENVANIQLCKCILEIVNDEQSGVTLRTQEALLYKKKLITNNTHIFDNLEYDDSNIFVYENNDNFDYNRFVLSKYVESRNKSIGPRDFLNYIYCFFTNIQ